MFDWSTTNLPNPSTDLASNGVSSVIRTQMDSGRARQRRRFTSQLRSITASWELDDDQYALFQGVVKYKLSAGADWFTISLPFGDGFKTYTARFVGDTVNGAYQINMHWVVKVPMEIEDASPYTEAETNTALGL